MTSRRPYLCTKQWIGGHVCERKTVLWELNSFHRLKLSFIQAIWKVADHVTENETTTATATATATSKSKRFSWQNNNSARVSYVFVHFFAARPWTTTTWNDQILSFVEDGNGKAINSTISVLTRMRSLLVSSNINSLLLSKWATCDNREMVWKDAESIFQRGFHGRRCCRIVRSLITFAKDQINVYATPKYGIKPTRYVTLLISARRSFSPSQKSRRHNRRDVLTKPYPVWFPWPCKAYPLWCEHILRFVDSDSNQC